MMKRRCCFSVLLLIAFLVGILSITAGNAAAAGKVGMALQSGSSLLLIPDELHNRVMGFDPLTGDLVDPDVIPTDAAHLPNPWQAMLSSDGNSILVLDADSHVVREYGLDGSYIGVFAPAGGANPAQVESPYGMAYRPNGNLLVSSTTGTNGDAIAEFNSLGTYVGDFVATGVGGLDRPFGILYRSTQTDYLVSGYSSHAIHQYDSTGSYVADFTAIETDPEQIALAANGNVLVAVYQGTQQGVAEFTSSGTLVGVYNPPTVGFNRGVYELPNGNILTTNDSGVYEIDRLGNLVETKMTGVDARYIMFAQLLSMTGFWVVHGQIGSAISIEVQAGHLAIGWGAYDETTGEATWLFSDGKMSSATTYTGTLYRFSGGSCFDCPYNPPTGQQNVGTITINFTSNTTATLNAFGEVKNIQRSVFQ